MCLKNITSLLLGNLNSRWEGYPKLGGFKPYFAKVSKNTMKNTTVHGKGD